MRSAGLIVVALWVASHAGLALADYDTGLRAANRGDYAAAERAWQPLAEQGNVRALTDLGFMYANGHGVEKDERKAVEMYQRAAEGGLALAQFNLGYMYMHGQGTGADPDEGLRWYRRAAEQGFVAAQFNLGVRYYTGEGVDRDLGEAYFWFALAERGGHARAGRARGGLAKDLTGPDRAALDARVVAWDPSDDGEALPPVATPAPARDPVPTAPAAPPAVPPGEPAGPAAAAEPTPAQPMPVEPTPAEPPAVAAPRPNRYHGAPLVQLGSLRTQDAAQQEWERLLRPNQDLLGDLAPHIQKVEIEGRGTYYRLRAGPLESTEAAVALCDELARRKVRCLTLPDE